jgi:rubrerythrin
MISKQLKNCIDEREIQEFPEDQQKLIEKVQICMRCGKKFPLKEGRKSCPRCQGLLRTTTMIRKVSQF